MSKIFFVFTLCSALSLNGVTNDEWALQWLSFFDDKKYQSMDDVQRALDEKKDYIYQLQAIHGSSLYSWGCAVLLDELPNYWEEIGEVNRANVLCELLRFVPLWVRADQRLLNAIYSAWSGEESRVCVLRLHEKMLEGAQQECPSIYTKQACEEFLKDSANSLKIEIFL